MAIRWWRGRKKQKSGEREKSWRDVQPSRAAPTALLLGWCLRQHLLQSCFPSMALAPCLHHRFWLKEGKREKRSSNPTYLGKALLACSALQPTQLALYSLLPSAWDSFDPNLADWAFLQRRRCRPSPSEECQKSPNAPAPYPTHGVGAGCHEVEKQRHLQPEEEANSLCLSQRCPRTFPSALPRTTEPHQGGKNSSRSGWA